MFTPWSPVTQCHTSLSDWQHWHNGDLWVVDPIQGLRATELRQYDTQATVIQTTRIKHQLPDLQAA